MPYKDPKKAKDYKRQYFQRMKDDPEFREKRNKIWKTYYERNKGELVPRHASARHEYYLAHKVETQLYNMEYKLKERYGLTLEELQKMWAIQGGFCAICGKVLTLKLRGYAIDHIHGTTPVQVRGILCYDCNLGLGNFKDNIKLLDKAIEYLNTLRR